MTSRPATSIGTKTDKLTSTVARTAQAKPGAGQAGRFGAKAGADPKAAT